VSLETKGYVRSLPKKEAVGGGAGNIRFLETKSIAQNTHLTPYILVKIKLSPGVIKIAGRHKERIPNVPHSGCPATAVSPKLLQQGDVIIYEDQCIKT
jgi:hypothetical protein